jgi:catechol 2,3-dioxygenase-like lactoylglutathione lyase family enzyme
MGTEAATAAHPILRVARPTDDLERLIHFYSEDLGFEILYRFADHDGFNGVMLGRKGAPWHLEFTRAHGHTALRAPSQDHLLVLYLPDRAVWEAAVRRMRDAGYKPVPTFNPYWDRNGATFEDPDGYRVVVQNAVWKL